MSATLRVLVVDDHPVVRGGLRALLDSTEGVEVVGEAQDGEEAVSRAVALRPDVVVMDLGLPRLSGVEATRLVRARAPEARVLVLTMSEEDEALLAAVRAGATGYLVKGASPAEVVAGVLAVGRGELVFGAGVAEVVTRLLVAPPVQEDPFPGLTARERQVLALLAEGLANPTIARRLGVSAKTVRNQVAAVLAKTGSRDRTDAVLRARAAGLGPA